MQPTHLPQLEKCLVDADDPHSAAGRVDDHIGRSPAELFDDLQPHRLLALQPVGLLEGGDLLVAAAPGDGRVDQLRALADVAVDQVQLGAGGQAFAPGDVGCALRHRDQAAHRGARRVDRPGGAGVAVGRHRDTCRTELVRPGHTDGGTTGLEAPGGKQALVFDQEPVEAVRGTEAGHVQQRGHALAEGHDVGGIADRQQLVVAPQCAGPGGDGAASHGPPDCLKVVARQQRSPAGAESLSHISVKPFGASGALEVAEEAASHQAECGTAESEADAQGLLDDLGDQLAGPFDCRAAGLGPRVDDGQGAG